MKKILFIIVFISSLCACKLVSQKSISVLTEIKLNIQEPSGITFFNNHLYITSDYNGLVYKTTLEGKVVEKIATDFTDLEGVAIKNERVYVVNENKRTLIKLKSTGETDKKYKIKGSQKKHNSGLEGLCFSEKEDCFFIVNESSPTEVLKVTKKGKELDSFKVDFANDLSGICFDNKTGNLWLVSDESQKIYEISNKGKLFKSYSIPVHKPEGIVIHNNKIYIVSDSENKLFVFKKP
ncbi:SdiA-regulated domain-containing protein [uncultured Lutibacter sp.]|uniref:SdiA-regulated domain-containing protein n=1 Tax=uncultured Lutibacter sp. TaxID=437739 RepID=UPI00261B948A|nr:SdiA-regulated domain-containing protein [uncultured Lutibacter sp.]